MDDKMKELDETLADIFGVKREGLSGPLELTPAMAIKPSIKRCKVNVPVGFVMPEGTVVKDGFSLLVEYGTRWHPEWDAPKATVNAWYIMPQGDAVGWAGYEITKTFNALLPKEVIDLAPAHGCDLTGDEWHGFTIPTKPQALSTFMVRRPHELN